MQWIRSAGEEHELEDGVSGLINGIIIQAAKDYLRARRWLRDHPDPEQDSFTMHRRRYEAERDLRDAKGFFRSEWYKWLCRIDPELMIRMLDEEVNDEGQDVSE